MKPPQSWNPIVQVEFREFSFNLVAKQLQIFLDINNK